MLKSLCLALVIAATPIQAKTLRDTRSNLSSVQENIQQLEQQISSWAKHYNKEHDGLANIEKQAATYKKEHTTLKEQLSGQQLRLKEQQQRYAKLKQEHQDNYERWVKIYQQMVKTSHQGQLPLLFQADTISQAQRQMGTYKRLSQARAEQVEALTIKLEGLLEAAEQLYAAKKKEEALLTQIAENLQKLETQRQARITALESLQSQIYSHKKQLTSLHKDEKELQKLFQELQSTPTKRKSSKAPNISRKLTPPVAPHLFHLEFKQQSTHPNFVPLEQNTPIQAIAPGHVVFAEWLRGVGLLIVVDHGEGLMSLYGHAEQLHKKLGEPVEAGELIANAGQTGGLTHPGLYFELRQDGKAVSPEPWFAH